MSLFVDKKFVSLIGLKLEKFKQKGDYLWNFRAPCCGDSKKSKVKTRGYFYRKKDGIFYRCHNCFQKDTTFLTKEYGIVAFKDVVGQKVTVLTRDGSWRSATVKSYGIQQLYRYQFSSGYNASFEVISTENHRWFLRGNHGRDYLEPKETTNLSINHRLLSPVRTFGITANDIAVVHGIVYGDGTKIYKSRTNLNNKYFGLRISKKDSVGQEIEKYLTRTGHNISSPLNLGGDKWCQGQMSYDYKTLPNTNDPEYIKGFIYGLWLADGYKSGIDKTKHRIIIATTDNLTVEWLISHAAYVGLHHHITHVVSGNSSGRYKNGKDLYHVVMHSMPVTCKNKEFYSTEEVFCVEEPITNSFVLGNGLLTGNCNAGMSLGTFIKTLDHNLYQQYQLETFVEAPQKAAQPRFQPLPVMTPRKPIALPAVSELAPDHMARKYVADRQIPIDMWKELFYSEDFKKFCEETFQPDRLIDKHLCENDARLVMPFVDEKNNLLGVQGRTLSNSKVRYITIKVDEAGRKLFGLNRLNFQKKIYVVEGPIDSMFLPNAVATMDSALYRVADVLDRNLDYVFVYDNEPRNNQVVKDIQRTIERGFQVCIFPATISEKDINDMVLAGHDVVSLIDNHTYEGLRATLEFNQWRKV